MVIRGGVYQVDLGKDRPRGHEQMGRRYGICLSPSNSPLSVATIVPTSRSARPGPYHIQIQFDALPSCALIEQTRAIDTNFIGYMVGYLPLEQLQTIATALVEYLGLDLPA